MTIKERIKRLYEESTPEERIEGVMWYTWANKWCKDIAEKYNQNIIIVTAITAVLSPRKSWDVNKQMVEKILSCGECGHFGRQKERALELLNYPETFLVTPSYSKNLEYIRDHIGGRKTTNFFMNILEPGDDRWVTIDQHMVDALNIGTLTPNRYELVSKSIKEIADEYNLVPCELQAIIWLVWKRLKKRTTLMFNE